MEYSKEWKGVISIVKKYWKEYGGRRAFITSPYVHFSVIFSLITVQYWLNNKWWEQSISILPSILGFTLGGFALFLGYGTEKFRQVMAIRNEDNGKSPYLSVVTTFVHFSVMQIIAIFFALMAANLNAFPYFDILNSSRDLTVIVIWAIVGFTGYFIFIYSLVLSFSVSFSLYRLASWYVTFETKKTNKDS